MQWKLKIALGMSALVLGLLFSLTLAYGQTLAKLYKTSNLGPNVVAVACFYSGDPVVDKHGSLIIVSCPSINTK